MRLDDENGIKQRGWLILALCAIVFSAAALGAAIALLVKLWMYLVTL